MFVKVANWFMIYLFFVHFQGSCKVLQPRLPFLLFNSTVNRRDKEYNMWKPSCRRKSELLTDSTAFFCSFLFSSFPSADKDHKMVPVAAALYLVGGGGGTKLQTNAAESVNRSLLRRHKGFSLSFYLCNAFNTFCLLRGIFCK
jgi:hypothetical protein